VKKLTNTEIILDIMNNSKHSALAQAFVLEAVANAASEVSRKSPDDFQDDKVLRQTGMGKAWIDVAKEIRGKLSKALKD
jgi:hypothetical protein